MKKLLKFVLILFFAATAYSLAGHDDQLGDLTSQQRAEIVGRWTR